MIKKISTETWKHLTFPGWKSMRNYYAISSHGRAASYKEDILADGKLLEGSLTSGYKTLNLHIDSNNGTIYIHREVAKLFNKKNSSKDKFVIHINYNKIDNQSKNLKWATQKEAIEHQQKSPGKVAYKKVQNTRAKGLKLTTTQVKAIKVILDNPRRKLTHLQIADKYKVTPMTIYRIKSGESWKKV
ncbi:MAG: NUMOD4 domain-containing protein [Bacteroidota bacterium]|nr:NUMOD4 domain-containing protein [Bacteroidota bacterium]